MGMFKQIIIIPCYNRINVTLKCLRHLKGLGILSKFQVMIVDDASNDGTPAAVSDEFPEVEIVHGTGNLFWTGSVEMGMRLAYPRGVSSFVWLNDDTIVAAGAIEAIVARAEVIEGLVSGQGQIIDQSNGTTTYFPLYYYGKYNIRSVPVDLTCAEIIVDSCRGNLVAISRKVVDRVGYPDGGRLPHVAGDTDYSLRASKAGLPVVVMPGALVEELCLVPTMEQSWLIGCTPITLLWRRVFQKRNGLYPPMVFIFRCRHWGLIGLLFAVTTYLKLVVCSFLRVIPFRVRQYLFSSISSSIK
jgi:GT2 family glycosyltransferase